MTHQTPRPDDPGIKVVTAAELHAAQRRHRRAVERSSTIPAMSAGLAAALLDADAETWRIGQAILLADRLASAIEFGDRIAREGAGS